MHHKYNLFAVLVVLACAAGFFAHLALAASQQITLGSSITIGQFVYNDDGSPYVSSTCTLAVYRPDGSSFSLPSSGTMAINTSSGWQSLSLTPDVAGTWPAVMTCGTAGVDLSNLDQSFQVIATSTVDISTSSIANVASSVASSVFNTPVSSLTASGTIGAQLAQTTTSTITSAVQSTFAALVNSIWSAPTRTLTSIGSLAADIWNNTFAPNRQLTTSTVSGGGNLALQSDVTAGTASVNTTAATNEAALSAQLASTTALISALNNVSAAQVWAYGARTVTGGTVDLTTTSTQAIWNIASSQLTNSGSIGAQIVQNLDAQISSRAASTTAADVWNVVNRTLTDYDTTSTALAVWNSGSRSLTDYGNNISAADVWNVLTSSLNATGTIGQQVAQTTTSTITAAVQSTFAALITDIWASPSRTLTSFGSLAADIWNNTFAPNRQLTTSTVSGGGNLALQSDVTSSVATLTAILNAQYASTSALIASSSGGTSLTTSSIANAVWSYSSRELTDANLTSGGSLATLANLTAFNASTTANFNSLSTAISNLPTDIAADVAVQLPSWQLNLSSAQSIVAGQTYFATLYTTNQNVAADAYATPTVTLYDSGSNVIVSNVAMTRQSAGIYQYSYSVPTSAVQGVWQTVVSAQVTSSTSSTIQTSKYWEIEGSPAQVIINSITNNVTPTISANITITNEGLSGYEYHYQWCVVTTTNEPCGNGNVFYGTASKFINSEENWNTNLTATVPDAGSYYFKLTVFYGTLSSSASRSFTAVSPSSGDTPSAPPSNSSGGGGGGPTGGNNIPTSTIPTAPITGPACNGADLNHDNKVDAVDFSILMAFWKIAAPWKNPCADINQDGSVDAVDFSIMMYQWGSNK